MLAVQKWESWYDKEVKTKKKKMDIHRARAVAVVIADMNHLMLSEKVTIIAVS